MSYFRFDIYKIWNYSLFSLILFSLSILHIPQFLSSTVPSKVLKIDSIDSLRVSFIGSDHMLH